MRVYPYLFLFLLVLCSASSYSIAVTPTQEMIDEGIAREVISRVQKLRKKAKLQPTDPITVSALLS